MFPAILTAWFMAKVEKIAQKYIPEVVSFVFVPTVTLILANVALFTVFGPLGNLIGDVLAGVIDILYNRMGVFGAFVFAAFLQPLVVTGTHQFIQGIEANLVATTGFNYIQAIWSVSIIAQGGGAIGMYLIHKKHSKERNICMSSFIPDAGRYLRARNLCCKHALLDHPVHLRLHRCRLRRCLREAL